MFISRRVSFTLSGCLATMVAACGAPAQTADATPVGSRYMRVDDSDPGRVRLEISSRTLGPSSGAGPKVELVGVVHIGDAAYYERLQEFLDGFDLVLYEGVKPGGLGDAPGDATADDAAKMKVTKSRIRMVAMLAERSRKPGGAYPASLEDLTAQLDGPMKRMAAASTVDAWGRPLVYELATNPTADGRPGRTKIEITSLGADGLAGGESAASDLRLSDQKPLSKAERQGGEGIQSKLARALGLEFQLTAMNYTRPTWRNSDLAVDEVQQKLEESGASGDALFSLMDGSSFGSKMLGFLLGFVERDPKMAMMIKLMLVETVSNAEVLAESQPGPLAQFMKVIVVDRNTAVLDDLRTVIAEEKTVKSVALFYGAGHLPDMEARLETDFGYRFESERWFTAMDLDLSTVPGGAEQASAMRRMVRQMVDRQRSAAGRTRDDAGDGPR